ncbi:MAG: hypothetical protein QOJ29_2266 [Thermoleophilaceae bacterium]|nr:hypothetical protein [Thermoleophilaceae bacterium]
MAVFLPLLVLFLAIAVASSARHPCDFHVAGQCLGDEQDYMQFAQNLSHGFYANHKSNNPIDYLWFGPGLPLLLTPFVAIGVDEKVLRLSAPLLLFGAVLMFYALLRLFAGRRMAVAGAYALGLYWPFWTVITHIASEPLAILLVVAALYGIALHVRSGSRRSLALAAASLGYLALTRIIFGWVIAGVLVVGAVWMVVARRRGDGAPVPRAAHPARTLVLACAGALLVCTPWLAYTYSETKRFFLWGNSGGLQLYWMAPRYAGTVGDWHSPYEVFTSAPLARHRPFFDHLETLPPLERDAELQRTAIRAIRRRPARYLANVGSNLSRMAFSVPQSFKRRNLRFLFYAVPNSLLLVCTVLSAGVLFARRRWVRPEIPAFAVLGGVAVMTSALVAAYPRMLFPAVPVALAIVIYTAGCHTRFRPPD